MDAFTLQKKLIVIPTPGQTEQEYLAQKLAEHGTVIAVNQENFQLASIIRAAEKKAFQIPAVPPNQLQPSVHAWLQTLTTS
jgi:UDP-N-acetylglucosamine transferase subunit ALG13